MNPPPDAPPTLDSLLALKREAAQRQIVEVDEPTVKLVIFALGEEWFALAGHQVREILPHTPTHFVPGCPPSLEGVINVRGDIESVIRLGEVLGLSESPGPGPTSILLGQATAMRSGLRVDRVIEVADFPRSAIHPPMESPSERLRHLTAGVLQFQGRPVILLDLERLFQDYARSLA